MPNPFDLSDEEIKENEETVEKYIKYGSLNFRQLLTLTDEIGDFIRDYSKVNPDTNVLEAIEEWHQTLVRITNI